jgi:hypothetical protein
MYYYNMLGRLEDANAHFEPLKRTVAELRASERRMRSLGRELLRNNGREVLEELSWFTRGPNYVAISEALRSQNETLEVSDAAAHGKRPAVLSYAAP